MNNIKNLVQKLILPVLSTTIIIGCNGGNNANTQPNSISNSIKSTNENIGLGNGFSNFTQGVSLGKCFVPSNFTTTGQGQLDSSFIFGAENFQKKYAAELSVSTTRGNKLANYSAAAKYANEQHDSNVTSSVYYVMSYHKKVNMEYKTDQNLFKSADSRYDDVYGETMYNKLKDGEITPEYFSIHCGDRVLDSYTKMAMFVIKLRFKFTNAEDKNEWEATIKASNPFVKGEGKTSGMISNKRIHGELYIEANQFGGNEYELGSVTSGMGNGLLLCSFDNLYACDGPVSSLYQYGQNFSSQFMSGNSDTDPTEKMWFSSYEIGAPVAQYISDTNVRELLDASKLNSSQFNSSRNLIYIYNENIISAKKIFDSGNSITSNSGLNDSENKFGEKDYIKTNIIKVLNQFDYDLSHEVVIASEKSSSFMASKDDCWNNDNPSSCNQYINYLEKTYHNFHIYKLNMHTPSYNGLDNDIAILNLDDGTRDKYIYIFDLDNNLYRGKIRYLNDENKSVSDNIGISLAKEYFNKPSDIYDNGYFYVGLSKVNFTLNQFSDNNSHPLISTKTQFFKQHDPAYCGEMEGGSKLIQAPYNCIPFDLMEKHKAENNDFIQNQSRLIISSNNDPFIYEGNGIIKLQRNYSAELSDIYRPNKVDMFDPAGLLTKYMSNKIEDNEDIYYTSRVKYIEPTDCKLIKPEYNSSQTKLLDYYDSDMKIAQSLAVHGKIRFDDCEYYAYLQGSLVNKNSDFILEFTGF